MDNQIERKVIIDGVECVAEGKMKQSLDEALLPVAKFARDEINTVRAFMAAVEKEDSDSINSLIDESSRKTRTFLDEIKAKTNK